MTPVQFERWKDFAERMAMHGWPKATEARKETIAHACDWFISLYDANFAEIDCWDGGGPGSIYVCDDIRDFFYEHYHVRDPMEETLFENQVSCCVRAGFDVAVYPSAGVVGFDVGTLRRMYNGCLPAWVIAHFAHPIHP